MTVEALFDGNYEYQVTGTGYESSGDILKNGKKIEKPHDGLRNVLRIGVMCNESVLYKKNGSTLVNGDPTEGALIIAAKKADIHQNILYDLHHKIDILPFNSGQNFMACIYEIDGEHILMAKGSPEEIAGRSIESDNSTIDKHLEIAEKFAGKGLRVLAMAYKIVPKNITNIKPEDCQKMIFAGLQGMMDPPRPDAKTSIQSCQKAGIRVIMITGDHTITAKAIGSYLGICSPKSQVVNGSELEQMSDRDLFNKVQEVSVFARVSPNHKLRIVEQLMKHDEIVAVTGDGVNDAPALKAAHIGIAMGKTGTDVAKEASDMVLRDDNFASIFKAVYEGRVVFENIRKAVAFLIPIGFSAIITLFITTILGLPTPFLPAQLLWINLVASGIPDLSLAFEPGDKQILDKPPRKRGEGIMSKILLQRSILVGLLISMGVVIVFIMSLNNGLSLETGRTMAVTTMVLFQFFQVLNARSETVSIFKISIFSNKFLLFGLLGSAIAHILVLYIPAFEWLFSMTPLSFLQWVLIIIMASSVIVAVETDKALRRKFNLNS
jgi:Ca2+-transporting ATPase